MLAIPADMGVAEFCKFLGGFLAKTREMRLVRKEGGRKALCLVLLRFDSVETADDVYRQFNNQPVIAGIDFYSLYS